MSASENDLHLGIKVLDQLGEGETGHVLMEHRGKPNDLILPPVDRGLRPRQKLGCDSLFNLFKVGRRATRRPGYLFHERLKGADIEGMVRVVPKEETGKEPLPDQQLLLTEEIVQGKAYLLGKGKVQIVASDSDALGL